MSRFRAGLVEYDYKVDAGVFRKRTAKWILENDREERQFVWLHGCWYWLPFAVIIFWICHSFLLVGILIVGFGILNWKRRNELDREIKELEQIEFLFRLQEVMFSSEISRHRSYSIAIDERKSNMVARALAEQYDAGQELIEKLEGIEQNFGVPLSSLHVTLVAVSQQIRYNIECAIAVFEYEGIFDRPGNRVVLTRDSVVLSLLEQNNDMLDRCEMLVKISVELLTSRHESDSKTLVLELDSIIASVKSSNFLEGSN